jgi:pSer/pThr/pTyr-binding forkhead associated (FHA) protein
MSREYLNSRTYVIGRAGDIGIHDRTVSGKHAELVVFEDEIYLTDLGSTNGTRIWRDGEWQSFREGYVQRSDRVAFGRHVCTIGDLVPEEGPTQVMPILVDTKRAPGG